MTDNIDSLFKDGLEKVKPGMETMQQDWEAMQSLMLTIPTHNGKLNGNIIGKKIFVAISVACVVLVVAYLLLIPSKKTMQQNATPTTVKTNSSAPQQFSVVQKTDTSLVLSTGNTTKNKTRNNPGPNTLFMPIDTTRIKSTAWQDSATAKSIDNPVVKGKTDAEILDSFYNLLKTPTQVFVIDNTKDTTIIGKDSSEITIPAKCVVTENGTVVNGKITFLIDECYSYSDIVARKLFTLSDSSLLESGGMLRIRAIVQNKELKLANGKNISVAMPAKRYNSQMQLFEQKSSNKDSDGINWALADLNNSITKPLVRPSPRYRKRHFILFDWLWSHSVNNNTYNWEHSRDFVTVFNLKDDPFKTVIRGDKIIGKFMVTKDCPLDEEQMIAELHKRYPGYTDIKITITSEPHSYYYGDLISHRIYPVIGDSIEILPQEADRLKLWSAKEKAQYYKRLGRQLSVDSAYYALVSDQSNKYFFSISKLGWINCDHFYNDPRSKVRYVINLKDTAAFYVSQLIFLNCRLMMPAQVSGNYISFAGIPEGEPVQLVSIGVKNGKVVASLQKCTVSKAVVNNVVYQEVGAEELKKQLRLSDMK